MGCYSAGTSDPLPIDEGQVDSSYCPSLELVEMSQCSGHHLNKCRNALVFSHIQESNEEVFRRCASDLRCWEGRLRSPDDKVCLEDWSVFLPFNPMYVICFFLLFPSLGRSELSCTSAWLIYGSGWSNGPAVVRLKKIIL